MKLIIDNYKCIEKINFELDESRLNFIYGISGSGKTSISEVISNELSKSMYVDNSKKVNSKGEINVNINDTALKGVNIFNEESIKDFIFDKRKDGLYEVIYRPSKELDTLKEKIISFQHEKNVLNIREKLINFKYNFEQLNIKLGIKFNQNGKLSANVTTKALNNSDSYNVSDKYTNSQISWLNKGLSEFEVVNKCPFCELNLDIERIKYIEALKDLKPDAISKIQNNTIILDELKIKQTTLDSIEESKFLQEELKDLFSINKEVEKLLKMLDNNYFDDDKIEPIKASEKTDEYFKKGFNIEINNVLEEINKSKNDYLILCKKYKGEFIKNFQRNISTLNKELNKLDLPYKFEKKTKFNMDEPYKITHKNCSDANDFSNVLSTGEKNLISLALFLIVNQNNDVIIDDPASSFDEYKRSKILKLIQDMRNDNKKFTLVLSHDQIFLKFLLRKYSKFWDCYILESKEDSALKIINHKDIDTILNHIISNLPKCSTYEQKIINLRMFYEIKKKINEDEYQYLSAILHGTTRVDIDNFLTQKGKSEIELINKIKDDTGIELTVYNSSDIYSIYDDVSNFERIFIKREMLSGDSKKMLDDVVHFNYGLIHMIDPFKYDFQAKEVYRLLEEGVTSES